MPIHSIVGLYKVNFNIPLEQSVYQKILFCKVFNKPFKQIYHFLRPLSIALLEAVCMQLAWTLVWRTSDLDALVTRRELNVTKNGAYCNTVISLWMFFMFILRTVMWADWSDKLWFRLDKRFTYLLSRTKMKIGDEVIREVRYSKFFVDSYEVLDFTRVVW